MAALLCSLPSILPAQRWDSITSFPVPSSFNNVNLNSITSGPDGALWFADSYQNQVGSITTAGVVTEHFVCCSPQGITSGPDGALWFGLGNAIGRMTTDGTLTTYNLPTCCANIQAITPGPDGALWFTEGYASRIGRITTAGVITEFTQLTNASPFGIVAGPDGALWFTEQNGNRIGRISTSGVIVEFPVPTCCGLQGITVGQDRALWFTELNSNKIGRITTGGVITEYPLPTTNSNPDGITGGPDGAVWFTEQNANRIGRITPNGVILEYSLPTISSAPTAISSGPDGALWFTESGASAIGRAAACGLGLNLSFANSNLAMGFDLGISTPANFGTYLIQGSGIKKVWSVGIPAIRPPATFTERFPGFPSSGSVAVFSILSTPSTGLTCYDLELVNTSGATAAALKEARQAIRKSGIVASLPEP